MVEGREEEDVFYSPMIRSQSYSEPVPLDCEFQEFLSFPPD